MNIREFSVVTSCGPSTHTVGRFGVAKITREQRYTNGDPFEHYCCYDEDGNLLVSVNCLAPCEVIYDIATPTQD